MRCLSVSESQIINLVLGKRDYTILSDSLSSENFIEYKNEYERDINGIEEI